MSTELQTGLSDQEAAELLVSTGPNELPSEKKRSNLRIILEVVRKPMFILLLACGSLYLLLGDPEEAAMLLGFVFVVVGITVFQERKTESALNALRDLSSPRALVIRGGVQKRVAGREVVPGDVMLVREGDRIPADGVVINCTSLTVDESLLTGESIPVGKITGEPDALPSPPGGEDLPWVFSGSLVVQGQGMAVVRTTGHGTEIGKIGKALSSIEMENTPLQQQTGRLVKNLAVVGAIMCIAVATVYALSTGNLLHGLLAGLTLGMALLPEEFPVVLTIFLALGAWRLSQHRVLTRRIPAVETLGSASVLCVDKTGTLTQNRMTVSEVGRNGTIAGISASGTALPEELHEIVEYSIMASPADPFDPMEKAITELGHRTLADTEHLHAGWALLREYPLSRELMAMTRAWKSPDGKTVMIAAKGAPEAIVHLCHMTAPERAGITEMVNRLAATGRRVIGIARAHAEVNVLPAGQHDLPFEFLGVLGLSDPIRPEVPEAVAECGHAGIRVIMITGDYPGTARNIARQIGLVNADDTLTGPELLAMNDDELASRVRTVNVYARMVPEQKLRLVEALKRNGEVVAMTGDGVNDAPALKAAHIGVAMGGRGTDVAREAGSLVLLDDDFTSIVHAVSMGRRIYDNLKKAMIFIFSVHVPIAGMSLLPVLLQWPLALFPVHIVFLELIIDPACSLVFESDPGRAGLMRRRPRKLNEPIFGIRTLLPSLLQGVGALAVVFGVYAFVLQSEGESSARATAFATLVLANLGLILTSRAWPDSVLTVLRVRNTPLLLIASSALVLLSAVLALPGLNGLFSFGSMSWMGIGIACGGMLTSILFSEALRWAPLGVRKETT